jgi:uncharacterized membrane protein HdeD (DUF308 family)
MTSSEPYVAVSFTDTFATPLVRKWWLVLLLGLAMIVIGLLLLFNIAEAAFTLAILVAFGLFVAGVDELVEAARHEVRWPSYVLAVIWIVTGVVALVWPDVTLWALAVTVGLGFLIGGIAQAVFAVRMHRELPGWGLWLIAGILGAIVGIVALVWPGATVLALAVLLGVWVLVRGVVTTMFALGLRQLRGTISPAVPT